MASVPAGAFAMGTGDPRGYADDGEGPVHEVELPEFLIGVHAVTNEEFAAFVEATGHRTTAEEYGDSFVFGGLLPEDFPETHGVARHRDDARMTGSGRRLAAAPVGR